MAEIFEYIALSIISCSVFVSSKFPCEKTHAIEDNNANLEYDPNIDRVGLYGLNLYNFDLIPNVVTVTDEDVEDININYFFLLGSPLRDS